MNEYVALMQSRVEPFENAMIGVAEIMRGQAFSRLSVYVELEHLPGEETKRADAVVVDLAGAPQVLRPVALLERISQRRVNDPSTVDVARRRSHSPPFDLRATLRHPPAWQL